jgi:hypothetical protein
MRHRRTFILIGAIGLAVLMTGLFVARATLGRAGSVTASPVTAKMTINAELQQTFAPPTASAAAAPALTAEEAYAQFMQHAGAANTTIPSGTTVQLGLFTDPVGPDCGPECSNLTVQNGTAYTALNQLAYGYSWHACPVSVGGGSVPPNPCIEWLFLDANTGKQIIITWQIP